VPANGGCCSRVKAALLLFAQSRSLLRHPSLMVRGKVIVLAAVMLVIGGLVAAEFLTADGMQAERPAPALPDQVLSGKRVTLGSLRGKPALINFWASWCPPCRQEAPELRRFDQSLHGRASLVGVAWNNDAASARKFIAQAGWRYPVLRDSSQSVGEAYGFTGLPATYVLDARGRIVDTLQGPQTAKTLRAALSAVH
jgi:cytochrome c biogenesis protein CcmG/thiol:disulfide interchange protein DsbE